MSSPGCIQEKPDEHKTLPLKSEEEFKFQIGSNLTATLNAGALLGRKDSMIGKHLKNIGDTKRPNKSQA